MSPPVPSVSSSGWGATTSRRSPVPTSSGGAEGVLASAAPSARSASHMARRFIPKHGSSGQRGGAASPARSTRLAHALRYPRRPAGLLDRRPPPVVEDRRRAWLPLVLGLGPPLLGVRPVEPGE